MSSRLSIIAIGSYYPVNSCIKSDEYLEAEELTPNDRDIENLESTKFIRSKRVSAAGYRWEICERASRWNLKKEKEVQIWKLLARRWTDAKLKSIYPVADQDPGKRLSLTHSNRRQALKRLSFWILPSNKSGNILVSYLGLNPLWDVRVQRAEWSTERS